MAKKYKTPKNPITPLKATATNLMKQTVHPWHREGKRENFLYHDPADMWGEAVEYFEQTNKRSVDGVRAPFSIPGLCTFLGISTKSFEKYSHLPEYAKFHDVCAKITDIIFVQKFEGAVVGTFNAAIIIRDLGLKDEIKSTGEMTTTLKISEETVKDIRNKLEGDV